MFPKIKVTGARRRKKRILRLERHKNKNTANEQGMAGKCLPWNLKGETKKGWSAVFFVKFIKILFSKADNVIANSAAAVIES